MLDQSFSPENLLRILGRENRKGKYLESIYFPSVDLLSTRATRTRALIKKIKKKMAGLDPDSGTGLLYKSRLEKVKSYKNSILEQRDKLLLDELIKVSADIHSKSFNSGLVKVKLLTGKLAYSLTNDITTILAVKQLQRNLEIVYSVHPSDRRTSILQLKQAISSKFPCVVYKTDISSFYESIDHNTLYSTIDSNRLLSTESKIIIGKILESYKALTLANNGVPRGVGISPLLSEIYMQEFDKIVRNMNGVIFYCRYVDDIAVVIDNSNPSTKTPATIIEEIGKKVSELGLSLNKAKTPGPVALPDGSAFFDYLGYRFKFNTKGHLVLDISENRLERYKRKIDRTLELFSRKKFTKYKEQRKLLFDRLRFLTGNTKLYNNKSKALVGSYFSNSLMDPPGSFATLDGYLYKKISSEIKNSKLKNKLIQRFSFTKGFSERIYYKFSTKRLKNITEAWSNES